MKRDTINYFTVGVFVLTLFAVFLVTLYRMTGSSGPVDRYYVLYDNVTGIKYGTPVLFEGYQIGQVEQIKPLFDDGKTHYQLTLTVTRGWKIRQDSVAGIAASGLLAAVSIDIREGEDSKILSPEDFIQGQGAENIFAAVNSVARELKDLSQNKLRPLLDNMNEQVTLISGDIRRLAAENIKPLLENQFGTLLDKLNVSADALQNILSENNQENVDQILMNLNSVSGAMGNLLNNLEESRLAVEKLLADLDNMVADNDMDIRAAVKDLKKSLYIISQHIDAVAHNVESSSRNMNEFTRQIRENPGSLLRGSPQPEYEGAR